MPANDYPIDLRVDYPERSSRGWAALTIILVKLLTLIPHGIILIFLSIAQMVVAFVAQVVVALRGTYPRRMFEFVTGVLRWSSRVSAFLFSLTDTYPPFSLQPDDDFAVDVVAERPVRQSRLYAAFTVLVEVLAVVGAIWFVVWLFGDAASSRWFEAAGPNGGTPADRIELVFLSGGQSTPSVNPQQFLSGGLLLRQIAALPHVIALVFLGIVAFFIWFVVQWAILFTGVYPKGMFDLAAGIMRWQTRVTAYAFGLSDRYPPFTLDPSVAAPVQGTAPGASAAPAQWYADPTRRHAYRYWDGTRWTPDVADEGVTGYDPLE